MKSFMKMLLASFGVMALMLAGCSSTDVVEEGEMVEDDSPAEDVVEMDAAEDAADMEESE